MDVDNSGSLIVLESIHIEMKQNTKSTGKASKVKGDTGIQGLTDCNDKNIVFNQKKKKKSSSCLVST